MSQRRGGASRDVAAGSATAVRANYSALKMQLQCGESVELWGYLFCFSEKGCSHRGLVFEA